MQVFLFLRCIHPLYWLCTGINVHIQCTYVFVEGLKQILPVDFMLTVFIETLTLLQKIKDMISTHHEWMMFWPVCCVMCKDLAVVGIKD